VESGPDGDEAQLELVSLRAEVEALGGELLDRYEEITLLYHLAQDMGAAFDVNQAAENVLARSLQVIPALLGMVLIGATAAELRVVAQSGAGEAAHRVELAQSAARVAMRSGALLMVHAGGSIPSGPDVIDEPVLVAPLLSGESTGCAPRPVGVVVLVGHRTADRFSAGEAQLGGVVARQLSQGIENVHVLRAIQEKERLESQLELAAQVQRSLLPLRTPQLDTAGFAAACLPAAQVGGDYYDYVPGPGGVMNIVVADVTGHGLGPGLITTMTRSILRAELQRPGSLAAAVAQTNKLMWDDLVATETFVTLFAARYDAAAGVVRFVNAGHHPALMRHPDGVVEELSSAGLPLGILASTRYGEGCRALGRGDAVLLFSDGVVEGGAPDGSVFGTSRLCSLLSGTDAASAQELVSRVVDELASFQGPDGQQDDVTVVAMRMHDAPVDEPVALA